MLNIRFEAQDNQYLRVITFPDGTTSQDIVYRFARNGTPPNRTRG